jgi:hypothetical protein
MVVIFESWRFHGVVDIQILKMQISGIGAEKELNCLE